MTRMYAAHSVAFRRFYETNPMHCNPGNQRPHKIISASHIGQEFRRANRARASFQRPTELAKSKTDRAQAGVERDSVNATGFNTLDQ